MSEPVTPGEFAAPSDDTIQSLRKDVRGTSKESLPTAQVMKQKKKRRRRQRKKKPVNTYLELTQHALPTIQEASPATSTEEEKPSQPDCITPAAGSAPPQFDFSQLIHTNDDVDSCSDHHAQQQDVLGDLLRSNITQKEHASKETASSQHQHTIDGADLLHINWYVSRYAPFCNVTLPETPFLKRSFVPVSSCAIHVAQHCLLTRRLYAG